MSFTFIIYIIIAMAVAAAVVMYQIKKMQRRKDEYFAQYPNAAKVYLASRNYLIIQNGVSVVTVDGGEPVRFIENFRKNGFYIKPGSARVSLMYTNVRPGIIYKTVTTTYGPTEKELVIEPGKTYDLSFDQKAEDFVFKET